jgi:nucleoid DNA-binding protein
LKQFSWKAMMETITRQELVRRMTQRIDGLSQRMAAAAIESFLDLIEESLAEGRTVKLSRFGSFSVRARAQRTVFHPQTKQPVTVPAALVPVFSPSETLKAHIQEP